MACRQTAWPGVGPHILLHWLIATVGASERSVSDGRSVVVSSPIRSVVSSSLPSKLSSRRAAVSQLFLALWRWRPSVAKSAWNRLTSSWSPASAWSTRLALASTRSAPLSRIRWSDAGCRDEGLLQPGADSRGSAENAAKSRTGWPHESACAPPRRPAPRRVPSARTVAAHCHPGHRGRQVPHQLTDDPRPRRLNLPPSLSPSPSRPRAAR